MNIYEILQINPNCTEEELERAKERAYDKAKRYKNFSKDLVEYVEKHSALRKNVGVEEYNKRIETQQRIKKETGQTIDIFDNSIFKDTPLFDEDLQKIMRQARINAANRLLDEYESEMKKQRRPKKSNKLRKFILTTSVIMAGVITATGLGVKAVVNKQTKEDNLNNVCVEYTVQEGDTKNFLDAMFEEYNESYLAVSGPFRNNEIVYAGDVVIGRTTMEKAQELVESGNARIISIEEAVELLGENHSLIGEFRRYVEGNSDIVFYVPQNVNRL